MSSGINHAMCGTTSESRKCHHLIFRSRWYRHCGALALRTFSMAVVADSHLASWTSQVVGLVVTNFTPRYFMIDGHYFSRENLVLIFHKAYMRCKAADCFTGYPGSLPPVRTQTNHSRISTSRGIGAQQVHHATKRYVCSTRLIMVGWSFRSSLANSMTRALLLQSRAKWPSWPHLKHFTLLRSSEAFTFRPVPCCTFF